MRLNGWQRVGIVMAILWLIGGGLWGYMLGVQDGSLAATIYGTCVDQHKQGCSEAYARDWAEFTKYRWYYTAFVGLVPIPLVWLAVNGIVGVTRWIRRGFAGVNE